MEAASDLRARLEQNEAALRKLTDMVAALVASQSSSRPSGPPLPSTPTQPDLGHTKDILEQEDRRPPTTVVRSLLSGFASPISASHNTMNLHGGTRVTTPLPPIHELTTFSPLGLADDEARRKKRES